jgi:hypothetical protein
MVEPATGNVKLILITHKYCHKLGSGTRGKLEGREIELDGLRLSSNFVFDCFDDFRTNGDEFNTHAHAPKAVANFASSFDHHSRSREPEAKLEDCALWVLIAGVDEHAVWADVRWPNRNVFLEPFVNHREFAHLRVPDITPDCRVRFVCFSAHG